MDNVMIAENVMLKPAQPSLLKLLREDVSCVFTRDPAARSRFEVLTTYPGVHAILLQRIAHRLWKFGLRYLARLLSWFARFITNITLGKNVRVGANSVVVKDVPAERTVVGIPAKIVLRTEDANAENIYGINLDHHLIPDPVGRAIACLMERIEVLEGQLRKQGEAVNGQCRTCDADDLCGTEVARVIRKA